jgi:erythronate-4-phosphate dehydrogenase
VVAALLVTAQSKGWILAGRTIGIIGAGHIGSLVEKKAAALGMQVMLCDPPLRESTGDRRYGFLDDVLDADILTLHVPLTSGGRYPTRHMISREVLQHFSPRQIVINSSRGAVVCGPDLKQALHAQRIGGAILDVWEGEPRIDYGLLDLAVLGTSHIAGSSQDGKVRGTAMIFEELCRHFGMASEWDSRDLFAPPRRLRPEPGTDGQEAIRSIVLQAYDIRRDDGDLRALRGMPEAAAATGFDRLRNEYVLRPEFPHFIVERAEDCDMARTFRSLGFTVADPGCASIVRQ